MQIASWGSHTFEVGPGLIRSFTGLTVRGGAEVDEKVSSNQKYVERKAGNAHEITLTAILNAYMGCDVRAEAMDFVEAARNCDEGYFYVGGKKLLNEMLRLTEATVSEIELDPNGNWVHAQVQLTLKQSEKGDAKGNGSATQSASSKKSSGGTKSSGSTASASTGKNEAAKSAAEAAAKGLKSVAEIIAKAKKASTSMKSGTTFTGKKLVQIAHE